MNDGADILLTEVGVDETTGLKTCIKELQLGTFHWYTGYVIVPDKEKYIKDGCPVDTDTISIHPYEVTFCGYLVNDEDLYVGFDTLNPSGHDKTLEEVRGMVKDLAYKIQDAHG